MTEPVKATLTAKTDERGKTQRRSIPVSFNPEKLDLTITNAISQNNGRNKREPPQFVTSSTAKLSVELIFDTTTDGSDVRSLTVEVAKLMKRAPNPSKDDPKPQYR